MIMSHLACASEATHALNETQRARFVEAAQSFPHAQRSLSATAGALIGPTMSSTCCALASASMAAARSIENNPNLGGRATLEAPILQVRGRVKGETIGYGATFTATKAIKTATCALGYADGFLRSASGQGYGVLKGKAAQFWDA